MKKSNFEIKTTGIAYKMIKSCEVNDLVLQTPGAAGGHSNAGPQPAENFGEEMTVTVLLSEVKTIATCFCT